MKKISGVVIMFTLSACKLGSGSPDSLQEATLSEAKSGGSAIREFCKTAPDSLGQDFKTEIDYLCQPTKNNSGNIIDIPAMMAKAYSGGNEDPKSSIEVLTLSSNGNDTKFGFIGALKVKKSLTEIDRVREKSLSISAADTQWGVNMSHSVVKVLPPHKPNQKECYLIKEVVKDPFGETIGDLKECFYGLSDNAMISFQKIAPEDTKSKYSNSIFLRLQSNTNETVFLVVTNKTVDNKGMGGIAEGVISRQAPQLLAKFHEILSQAPEAESLPAVLSMGDAQDFNQINVDEDWSWGRTKLSCKPDTGIYRMKHTTDKKSILQIGCGVSMKNQALNSYRYEELRNGITKNDEINCRDDEYAAGVSYVRYIDKMPVTGVIVDGVKSLLCMKKKTASTSCTQRLEGSCELGEYIKGVSLARSGGFICATGSRLDDAGKGCHLVKSVSCCK